ncbi:lipocalin family protein [Pontibacter chitinilyticus]|uniref:lipocalin family protein n=1 Tax=Pontibacter chitinilyticus TaxID=2674989 RepID=UPI00321B7F57
MKMKIEMRLWQALCAMLLAVVLVSCGGKDEVGSQSLISGADNKTWKTDRQEDATGDKQKLSDAEKQQNIQFYADGRFAMGGGSSLQTGTWSFDEAAKRLSLQFENENVTQNFDVQKLTDDEMRLKAADGSLMTLESE